MKTAKFPVLVLFLLLISSCGTKEKPSLKLPVRKLPDLSEINIPVDKGFNEYITGYTSGIIPANSPVEIRFTPEFAARANRKTPMGLFVFEPAVKGKAEWTDEVTLVFRPAKPLDSGIKYTGKLNLGKLAEVTDRLNIFPIRIQTVKKDFMVTTGFLESSEDGSKIGRASCRERV